GAEAVSPEGRERAGHVPVAGDDTESGGVRQQTSLTKQRRDPVRVLDGRPRALLEQQPGGIDAELDEPRRERRRFGASVPEFSAAQDDDASRAGCVGPRGALDAPGGRCAERAGSEDATSEHDENVGRHRQMSIASGENAVRSAWLPERRTSSLSENAWDGGSCGSSRSARRSPLSG